jgi:sulfide:quinone oxidoreductase
MPSRSSPNGASAGSRRRMCGRWNPVSHYETLDGRSADPLRLRDAAAALHRRRPQRPRSPGGDITARGLPPNGFMKVDADYRGPNPTPNGAPRTGPTSTKAGLSQPVRRRHRLRSRRTRSREPHTRRRRRTDRAGAAAHRHAVGHDRQGRRPQHRGHAPRRRSPTHAASMADDGRRLRGLGRRQPVHRHRGLASPSSDRARLRTVSRLRPRPRADFGEIGLAGHWIKILLHHLFLHKARLRPGWSLIPE